MNHATKENEIEIEQNYYIVAVENKYFESLKAIKKYNPRWFDLVCEISQKEVILIKGKESFENLLQATLDAEINRTASAVTEESFKNKNKALGESIYKESFVNSINAQSNKTNTEFVEPKKSQCLDGLKLMFLKDKSTNLNLKREEENAHDDPISSPMFLKYDTKHEKLMPSLKCEENGTCKSINSQLNKYVRLVGDATGENEVFAIINLNC